LIEKPGGAESELSHQQDCNFPAPKCNIEREGWEVWCDAFIHRGVKRQKKD
jgi:hypothetical protein